ncbi:hypothetical protein N7532_009563 [Penicillium argentinense]|uniref:Uncharacterized protein n=1 Tax=Penicillium argentinense TaxID=1131581 RepID=A0A9W9EZR9_9EURO|nr:uncharacterized protein N7532_009563 [Penicillium argentinense]KAJ5090879.1 hypothetical protein N7532_009563 [Penicillium argentinense]
MALTRAAIIVIVLVACLAVTALGAAIFRHYNPSEDEGRYNFSHEQQQYMRSVRLRNLAALRAEAMAARHELDSRCSYYTPSVETESRTDPQPHAN